MRRRRKVKTRRKRRKKRRKKRDWTRSKRGELKTIPTIRKSGHSLIPGQPWRPKGLGCSIKDQEICLPISFKTLGGLGDGAKTFSLGSDNHLDLARSDDQALMIKSTTSIGQHDPSHQTIGPSAVGKTTQRS